MAGNTHRIIGRIYYESLKPIKVFSTTDQYFQNFLKLDCGDNAQSDILQYDYFSKPVLIKIKEELKNEKGFIDNLNLYISGLSKEQRSDFNSSLKDIVDSVENYSNSHIASIDKAASDAMENYDAREKKRLSIYYSAKGEIFNLAYNTYLLIYFAAYKKLPSNFFFGINFQKDLNEFNEEVTCKYGVTSKPGIRAIISLAERKTDTNLFALYEYADMLYYGSDNGPSKNIKLAFDKYLEISSTNENSPCHPLAQWTLAYIFGMLQ